MKSQGQWSELHHSDGNDCAAASSLSNGPYRSAWQWGLPHQKLAPWIFITQQSDAYILYSWELDSQLPAYFRLQWSKGDDHTHKEKVSGHSFIIVMATIMQPQLVLAMGPIL